MKRTLLALAVGTSLGMSAPVLAQSQDGADTSQDAVEEAFAGLAEAFPRDPLTPEQEARLPAAKRIIALVIPEGTMAKMMGSMFDDMLSPMMQMAPAPSQSTIAKGIGVSVGELTLSDEDAADIASIFDTAWAERQDRQMSVFPQIMTEIMSTMEPGMREVMSELYAIKFNESDLAAIEAFFSTETGAKYASESFAMASDPRVMSASMEMMPALMGALGDMEARMAEAVEDLPQVRSYNELTKQERIAITKATGLTEKDIRANLKAAEVATTSE